MTNEINHNTASDRNSAELYNKSMQLTDREDLYQHINELFPSSKRTVKLADHSIEILRVDNKEEVLDKLWVEVTVDDAAEQQPYWVRAWESSVEGCVQISHQDLKGKSVLDLGCGMGITGTYAAARGANVVLADAVPYSLMFCIYNSWPWKENCEVKQVNWIHDNLGTKFDYIIGADIMYDKSDWAPLMRFWQNHLKEDGEVVLIEPCRRSCDGFADWISPQGWSIKTTGARSNPTKGVHAPKVELRTFRLTLTKRLAMTA